MLRPVSSSNRPRQPSINSEILNKAFCDYIPVINTVAALNSVFVSFIQIDWSPIASGSNLTPLH
jgi:hypothetical protein